MESKKLVVHCKKDNSPLEAEEYAARKLYEKELKEQQEQEQEKIGE